MRAADYPYPPDEFDAAAAGGPQGVHRRPRSTWSRWWPFLVILVVVPALAYAAVTIASGGNPLRSSGAAAPSSSALEPSTSAEPSAPVSPTTSQTPSQAPVPASDPSRAIQVQNSTKRSGLASGAKSVLAAAGFTTVSSGNFAGKAPAASVVYYPATADAGTAAAVAAVLKIGVVTESAAEAGTGILVVLAADYAP